MNPKNTHEASKMDFLQNPQNLTLHIYQSHKKKKEKNHES